MMHQHICSITGLLLLCLALLPSSSCTPQCDSNSGQCAWQEQDGPTQAAADASVDGQSGQGTGRSASQQEGSSSAGQPAPPTPGHAHDQHLILQLQRNLDSATQQIQDLTAQVKRLNSIVEAHQSRIEQLSTGAVLQHYTHPEQNTGQTLSSSTPGHLGSAWLDHFLLLSVLRQHPSHPNVSTEEQSAPVSSHTVAAPLLVDMSQPAAERAPRHVVLGGDAGRASIYSTRGSLAAHVDTGSTSRITAIASYPLKRNESMLVTGHADGEVRLMSIIHTGEAASARGAFQEMRLKHVLSPGVGKDGQQQVAPDRATPITQIIPVRSGSRQQLRKHIAVWDESGWLRLLRDNSSVRVAMHANRTLLASTQSGILLVSLSSTHAMVYKQPFSHVYKAVACMGLNGTRMVAAAFDPARQHRAYAVNDEGQLLMLSVPHENKANACRVLRAYPLAKLRPPFSTAVPDQPAQSSRTLTSAAGSSTGEGSIHDSSTSSDGSRGDNGSRHGGGGDDSGGGGVRLAALRGYLLLSHISGGLLLNVTSLRMPSDALVAEQWGVLTGMLEPPGSDPPPPHSSPSSSSPPPLHTIAAGSGLVLLGLPNGALAVMESELPVVTALQQANAAGGGGKNIWAQPVFVGAMMIVGMWQFFKARGRAGSGSPLQFSSRSGGLGTFPDISELPPHVRMARPGARARDVLRDAAQHARSAARQERMSVRDILQQRGELDMAAEVEEEEEEQEVMGLRPPGMQATNNSRPMAYGGFAGPRSIRRAMKLGVPPITEEEIQPQEDG